MLAIPSERTESFWSADVAFRRMIEGRLSESDLAFARPLLERMGASAAQEASGLAVLVDREEPRLETHDARGVRVDEVVLHPAYRRLQELSYGEGIVALKYDGAVREAHGKGVHAIGFALGYLFAQAEAGLYCPICMTDGAARVLERHAPEALRRELIPRLASRDPGRLYSGAMFLTEASGGSDVGAFETRARPLQADRGPGSAWGLTGKKWFCSNVDAQVILVLARPEGAADGTRGLGLYVIVRDRADGPLPGFRIERLKRKLGVRSMATGEVELDGCTARLLVGPPGGFVAMADMINLSRLYNAVTAVALCRRALYEAAHYGRERRAFGQRLVDLPLFAQSLAIVGARHRAAMHLTFDAVSALDGADGGDELHARRVRLLTSLAKYHTGHLAVWGASQCLEALAGNGYVEDFPLARILRDAQVLPIWEGTSNIQLLDMHRSLRRERAHEPVLQEARRGLARLGGGPLSERVARELELLAQDLEAAAADAATPRGLRGLADRLAWLLGLIALGAGDQDDRHLAALLLGAGPGLAERPGCWDAVPDDFPARFVGGL